MKYGVADALQALKPGAQWSCLGNVYSGITWLDSGQTIPTEAQVTAKIAALIHLMRLRVEFVHHQKYLWSFCNDFHPLGMF